MLGSQRRSSVFFHVTPLEKKKTGALYWAFQKIDFCGIRLGISKGYPQAMSSYLSLEYFVITKQLEP